MSATDELRAELTKRGIEYRWEDERTTYWYVTVDGEEWGEWTAIEMGGYLHLSFSSGDVLTPVQAIAATLGRDNSDVVQRLMELRGGHYGWSRLYRAVTGDLFPLHTSCTENEAKFIEKLLKCMVGVGSVGTCHMMQTCHVKVAGVDYYDDDYECSECGAEMFEGFNFCPNCGRRVVEVDV